VSLSDRINALEPRERTLLLGFGAVVAAMVLFLGPIVLHAQVSEARDENQAIRDFLERLDENRAKVEQKRAEREALLSRYAQKLPVLATLVEDAAKQHGVELAESQNRPEVPHGKRYVERSVSARMRKVGMLGLARMLEKLAKSPHPITISRLSIKPRGGEPDSYDVELVVSGYERKNDPAPKPEAPTDEAPTEEGEAP
jgi:general secretion pathway protein M